MTNASAYVTEHLTFSMSAASLFEIYDGFMRKGDEMGLERFKASVLPEWEVLHPDGDTAELAARIYAALDAKAQRIGLNDTYIAATAIQYGRVLISSNLIHFQRVKAAGFALDIANWRDTL